MVPAESSFRKEERLYAGMAELADAQDSGSCRSNSVQVQVLLPAPSMMVYKSFLIDHLFAFSGVFLPILSNFTASYQTEYMDRSNCFHIV